MSATRIIAQANPQHLTAYPGWGLPTRLRVIADIAGGAGAATVRAADTTPGVSVSHAGSGVYDITFPAGKGGGSVQPADINALAFAAAPSTAAQRSYLQPDASTTNTNVTTGKLRVVAARATDGTAERLKDGDVLDVSFTVDYGK